MYCTNIKLFFVCIFKSCYICNLTIPGEERHTCFISHMTPRHHQGLSERPTHAHGSRGQDICARLSTMTSHSPHGQTDASSDVTDIRQRMANLWMSRRDEIRECCHKVIMLSLHLYVPKLYVRSFLLCNSALKFWSFSPKPIPNYIFLHQPGLQKNHDFFLKIKKIGFIWFKSDFFI